MYMGFTTERLSSKITPMKRFANKSTFNLSSDVALIGLKCDVSPLAAEGLEQRNYNFLLGLRGVCR